MTRLVLKIFLAYWLAAGVVILVSDFEPHRHMHNPELKDALDSSLALNGRMTVEAYRRGGCAEMQRVANGDEALSLATPDGRFFCGQPAKEGAAELVIAAGRSGKRTTANYARFQMVAIPLTLDSGKPFVIVMKSSYKSALQVNGLLPGYTTITISGVVTLFLAFLVALPIRRLRKAAQKISMGDLDARVKWGTISARVYGMQGGDDIARLVTDFNHMAERLQMLATAQRLLLRDVSHELRSPLARLRVGLGLARLDAPICIQPHLDRIETESTRVNELIGQILSLSSMETIGAGQMKTVVDLSTLVRDLIGDAVYEAAQKQCIVTASIAADCLVHGDAELLRSAVDNVLRNALRYAAEGGSVDLTLVRITREATEYVAVTISDRGPGIPEHELHAVLEPFYRADRSRHRRQDGFGIGLAIARRAAAIHGGAIELRNRAGGGLGVELSFAVGAGIAEFPAL